MQTEKATKKRFVIGFLLFLGVVINYMDRSNLSLAAPLLGHDLHLNSVEMGFIFSAFGWSYAILQIPGGLLVDRIKPRLLYAVLLCGWSVATCLQSLVNNFSALFGLRVALGAFEAPSYPTNNKVITTWFPEQERATSTAFYTSGQYVGIAFFTPLLVYIQSTLGWRGMLFLTGVTGVLFSLVWYLFYRSPKDSKANEAELDYIRRGGGLVDADEKENGKKADWLQLKYVLKNRNIWGVFIAQFCLSSILWFFLTWFPTYLVQYRGMAFIKMGFMASLPFLAAYVGILLSGFISDTLIKRGHSTGFARKVPIVTGLALATSIVGANYVQDQTAVILFMALAFFGNGLASITWVFVSALAPSNLLGLTGGMFNFMGNLSAIAVPIIIGILAKGGNFKPALVFISALALIGALSYLFIVGEVKRIVVPEKADQIQLQK
ncbi:d-galactonate transporter [Lucifera butyrica]|uniref:D-galactonate transporter n=1 Tax=Lucifera butyrica TaxID=1351585 RepID=A0A498R8J3_9FIRM|nr:MFS transporter [Lucifera butyrica]VBB07295.1 d-galactonate transporter [Lucifera butyrica]